MRSMVMSLVAVAVAWALAASPVATAADRSEGAVSSDAIPRDFEPVIPAQDFTKRVVMIPMRDGVKLHTIIYVPKGARGAPMLMNRSPYDALGRSTRDANSTSLLGALPLGDEYFVKAGYIRIYQDVRGKYGSEGDYVMTLPARGPLNPTATDHATDTWDTIEWLLKNVPESNGRVGI